MDFLGKATRHWFTHAFASPTEVQRQGWERIHAGEHALLIAPTGSGKTLAAFLYALDRLTHSPAPEQPGVQVVYVSPLKALVYDIERNLRTPLAGIQRAAALTGDALRVHRVDVRTGDTSAQERRRMLHEPGEILVTTPESLYSRPAPPRARPCAPCSGSSWTRSMPWPPPSAARTWRSRWSGSAPSRATSPSASASRPPLVPPRRSPASWLGTGR
jgi:Lhr-like helicase